jgi:lysophospholipase L1-like esterase
MRLTWGRRKAVIYSLLPVVILFSVLEGAARMVEIWLPPWEVDYGWGFTADSRLFVPSEKEPGQMITAPAKETCFRRQRFSMSKPEGIFRVFMIGESSVNYLMDDFPDFTARLHGAFEGRYQFEVINAGGLSYGSHRLVLIMAEILEYEPDLVLVYVGHNEFEEIEQLELARPERVVYQRLMYKSALCRFIRDKAASAQVSRMVREKNRQILETGDPQANLIAACRHDFTPDEIAARMETFDKNMATMVSMCQERAVPVILGSVPSNHFNPALSAEGYLEYQPVRDCFRDGEYARGLALGREILRRNQRHQSSDAENDIIRRIASQHNVPLADVEAAVIAAEPHRVPGETLFIDMCHLSPEGNRILLDVYYEQAVALIRRMTPSLSSGLR